MTSRFGLKDIIYVYDKKALKNDETIEYYNVNELECALEGNGVCTNFAGFTQALLGECGVNSYNVSGIAKQLGIEGLHAWNTVEIEGEFYLVDSTWSESFFRQIGIKTIGKTSAYMTSPDRDDHVGIMPESYYTGIETENIEPEEVLSYEVEIGQENEVIEEDSNVLEATEIENSNSEDKKVSKEVVIGAGAALGILGAVGGAVKAVHTNIKRKREKERRKAKDRRQGYMEWKRSCLINR